jgi:membrane protein DedA with SNARE-associated domain
MQFLSSGDVPHLISSYGYLAVAVIIGLESMGLPLPGETTLVAASIIAGATTGTLSIWLVIAAAAGGAIVGDNIGFWLGRRFGYWLLVRYGRYVRLTEARIKIGQYLFLRHGGKVVFFGRFVAILRALAAVLAGANRMPWSRFLIANACGAVVWATAYGLGAYFLGEAIDRLVGPVGITLAAAVAIATVIGFIYLRRHEAELERRARAALPGPLAPMARRRARREKRDRSDGNTGP